MQHLSSKQTSPSPAAGLRRIVGCLTPEQTRRFTRKIELVSGALAGERSRTGSESGAPAPEGVRPRHSQRCPSRHSGICGCSPRWEAWVYSMRDKAKVRKTFSEHWEAKARRHEQLELASINRLRVPSRLSLAEAGSLCVEMAQEGQIRNRSGRHYKPSIRSLVNTARVLWRGIDLITGHDDQLLIDPTHGLRHGELRALQVRDVDLERRRIYVQRDWDQYEGESDPKSEKGTHHHQPCESAVTARSRRCCWRGNREVG